MKLQAVLSLLLALSIGVIVFLPADAFTWVAGG